MNKKSQTHHSELPPTAMISVVCRYLSFFFGGGESKNPKTRM